MNEWGIDLDAVARLVAAVVLGGLVGAERERSDQPAGLRTHIAVASGACLFGVISTMGFLEFEGPRSDTNVQVDVTRVASQVVVGIGFLGAGMIFRQGTVVRNLTTAASLWAVAAIGLAAGVGSIGLAGLATLVLLASLALLRPVRTLLHRRSGRPTHEVAVHVQMAAAAGLLDELHGDDRVELARVARDGEGLRIEVTVAATPPDLAHWIGTMVARPEIVGVDSELP